MFKLKNEHHRNSLASLSALESNVGKLRNCYVLYFTLKFYGLTLINIVTLKKFVYFFSFTRII